MVVQAALKACGVGIRPIPIVKGSKKASIDWGGAGAVMPATSILELEFGGDCWIAAQAGAVSGNLECLDFDDPECYSPWLDVLEAYGMKQLTDSLYVQQTPRGGFHVVYRCEKADGNLKLAQKWGSDQKEVRIETRGEGGYFLIAPSPGYVPQQGSLAKLPVLTPLQRKMFLDAARTFDVAPKKPYVTGGTEGVVKPGKDYDSKVSWQEVLEPHGIVFFKQIRSVWHIVRPGKKPSDGISATIGYAGTDLLYVFSSNFSPFEPGSTYSKFAAYAFLNHNGDFTKAARELGAKGFGDQTKTMPARAKSQLAKTARKSLADYEPEEPKFVYDDWQYLRDEQCNLLDAKGGSGKTTFIAGLAAGGSTGFSPLGGKCEPFTTLYYGGEDSGGELRSTFDDLGGDPSKFIPVLEPFVMDDDGVSIVTDDVADVKPRLVVFDAAKYYLPGGPRSEFDAQTVARFFNDMRQIARAYACAFLFVRHFSKYTKDKDLLECGAGISQWRDSCRSQLVMISHPTKGRNSVVWHTKGSLRAKQLPAFGCGFSGGQYGYWRPSDEDLALFGMDDQGGKSTGRPAEATAECEQMLCDFLRGGPKRFSDIKAEAERIGISERTVYRTGDKLNINRRAGVWKLYDPYE